MRSSLLAILVLIPGPLLAAEKGRKFALLIGVSKYDPAQLHDLPHAEKDVSDFADVLVKKCGFRNDHVHLMTSSQGAKKFRYSPTAKNIRRMLSNLVQFCEKDDTLILGFAGHGIQFTREKDNYFCPTDADLEKKSTLINLQKEVYLILEKKCAARVKLLFVDACRNDPRTRQARSRATVDLQKLNRPQALEMPKGLAAFFSCRAGEESFEDRNLGHGVFFHFVIKGLNGGAANRKGDVTLPRLRSYVRTEVSAYVFNKFGKVQRPDLKENSTDVITLVGEPEAAPPKKTTLAREITNSIGMKLRLIPAGTFLMGAPTGKGYADEHPQHEVEITKPFYMGVYEVTQEQYQRIMGKNPSVFSKDGTYRGQVQGVDTTSFPVENVSWNDAVEFCKKLRALSEVFRLNRVYRLPTEAEWEYACRGGAKKYQEFAFGDALS